MRNSRMMLAVRIALAVALTACAAIGMAAETSPEAAIAIGKRIDAEIDRVLAARKIPTSPAANDADFLRRAYLDFIGRVPSVAEARAFLDSTASDKRTKLIDQLLADPRYGEHFADLWVEWMTDEEITFTYISPLVTAPLRAWLAKQFNENRPWSEIVRELIAAEGKLSETPQAIFFQLNANFSITPEPALLAQSTARLFLGRDIKCTQCHDHPFRADTQAEYWGLAAFYARLSIEKAAPENGKKKSTDSIVRDAPAGFVIKSNNIGDRKVLEKPEIAVPASAFKNIGKLYPAALPTGNTPELSFEEPFRPVLANWLTSPDNAPFACAVVNRYWGQLFGRGLVNPIDDMHADNPASHPELLDYLAAELVRSNFDLKLLLRGMALSRAYQRSSVPVTGNDVDDPLFARQRVKVISAEMLLDSLCAALEIDEATLFAAEVQARKAEEKRRDKLKLPKVVYDPWNATPRIRFLDLFQADETEPGNLPHGIPQSLRRMNDGALWKSGSAAANLAKRELEQSMAIEEIYLATLSRRPTAEEQTEGAEFLSHSSTTADGYASLYWLLMNTSEFLLVR